MGLVIGGFAALYAAMSEPQYSDSEPEETSVPALVRVTILQNWQLSSQDVAAHAIKTNADANKSFLFIS